MPKKTTTKKRHCGGYKSETTKKRCSGRYKGSKAKKGHNSGN